eukprot:4154876-Pyramimonas_sp.AAC.1
MPLTLTKAAKFKVGQDEINACLHQHAAADSTAKIATAYHDFAPTLTWSRGAGFWASSHRR